MNPGTIYIIFGSLVIAAGLFFGSLIVHHGTKLNQKSSEEKVISHGEEAKDEIISELTEQKATIEEAKKDRQEKHEELSSKMDKGNQILEDLSEKVSESQRSLSIDAYSSKLSQFSNIKVYLHWQADDNETVVFKNNIYQCLSNAKWQVIQSAGHVSDSSVQNVIFDINSTLPNDSKIVLAAEVLKSIFYENNITAHILKNPDNHLTENEMYMRIGAIK